MQSVFKRLFSRRSGSIVGVDLGAGAIKVAESVWQGGKARIRRFGIIEISGQEAMAAGFDSGQEKLAKELRQVLTVSGISARDAVVAVGGSTIFVREAVFPAMTREELREAIKWDIEKYIPYAPDTYYLDFDIVGPVNSDSEMKVLLVAAPQDTVDRVVNIVKSAGLKPLAVDIEPLALSRTLRSAQSTMALDIGDRFSRIVIYQDGSPAATRVIPMGGRRFTEEIMRGFGLEYAEAERLKQRQRGLLQKSAPSEENSSLHWKLALLVSELAREVSRTAEYFQAQKKGAVVNNLILTGGGSKLDNLAYHLGEQVDLPLVLHDSAAGFEIDPNLDRQYVSNVLPQLAVAFGLALRGGDL